VVAEGIRQLGVFDLYDMLVYGRTLSEAEAQAVLEVLMQAHDIVPITSQLVHLPQRAGRTGAHHGRRYAYLRCGGGALS
jgi:hypothetical protein